MKNYNFRPIFPNFNDNFEKKFSNFSQKFGKFLEVCIYTGFRGEAPPPPKLAILFKIQSQKQWNLFLKYFVNYESNFDFQKLI